MAQQEYKIPERNLGWIQGKIAVLNKRAEKLGVAPIEMRIVSEEMRQVPPQLIQGGPNQIAEAVDDFSFGSRAAKFYKVTVSGDAPVINGWTFVATLQHVAENGNSATIVLAVPGETVPEQYRATDGRWCDHCRTRRDRNDTFIVKNVQPTINMNVPVLFKQVGRQCLKDFLGHVDPHKLADWATQLGLLDQLFRGAECEDDGRGPDWRYINTSEYLAYVAEAIARDGWLSRGKAREKGSMATADRAIQILEEDDIKKRIVPTKANIELAKAALAWAREKLPEMVNQKPDNDFLYNLATVTRLEYLGEKMLGIAAALFPVYTRETKVNVTASEHFGVIGERSEFILRVVELRNFTSGYGEGVIVRFEDASGNTATWFTGSGGAFTPGKTFHVKATVKRHDVYRGAKQTVLNRVQIVEAQ